jgi:hypothetical protein
MPLERGSDGPARAPENQRMGDALYLPNDVYLCVTQGHAVFLDLKRDKYSAVIFPPSDDAATHAASSSVTPSSSDDLAARLFAQRGALLNAGLLTTDARDGRPIAAAAIEGIDAHLFGLDDQRAFGLTGPAAEGLGIGFAELWDFFAASRKASRDLKTKHISAVVTAVRRRKERAGAPATDLEKLRRLTAIFRRLRPWYPRKYLCLYDSLALVEFLARRRVYPLWVFAVQAQPFGAHCWVQNERLLLNEGTEYAGQFTPIMAI